MTQFDQIFIDLINLSKAIDNLKKTTEETREEIRARSPNTLDGLLKHLNEINRHKILFDVDINRIVRNNNRQNYRRK